MKHIDIYCLLLIYTESKEKQNFLKTFLKKKIKNYEKNMFTLSMCVSILDGSSPGATRTISTVWRWHHC